MIIYRTINLINNKFYIGQDSNNNPDYFGSGLLLKRAIAKYGKESFKKEIICQCSNKEELNQKEIYWIQKLQPSYNITIGGIGGDTYTNHPNKKRISKKHSLKSVGINNPMYGKSIYDVWLKKYDKNIAIEKIAKHRAHLSIIHENNKGKSVYSIWLKKYGKEKADQKFKQLKEKIKKCNSGIKNGNAKKVFVYNEFNVLEKEFPLIKLAAEYYGYHKVYFGSHIDRIINDPNSQLYNKKIIFKRQNEV